MSCNRCRVCSTHAPFSQALMAALKLIALGSTLHSCMPHSHRIDTSHPGLPSAALMTTLHDAGLSSNPNARRSHRQHRAAFHSWPLWHAVIAALQATRSGRMRPPRICCRQTSAHSQRWALSAARISLVRTSTFGCMPQTFIASDKATAVSHSCAFSAALMAVPNEATSGSALRAPACCNSLIVHSHCWAFSDASIAALQLTMSSSATSDLDQTRNSHALSHRPQRADEPTKEMQVTVLGCTHFMSMSCSISLACCHAGPLHCKPMAVL
mmetsp:Transcript_63574/g.180566  ORF Transcript_63574/g.180566 Transcript_63574/m.180566 type:complete len:269 (-) Transcript_63574:222-1028(-)